MAVLIMSELDTHQLLEDIGHMKAGIEHNNQEIARLAELLRNHAEKEMEEVGELNKNIAELRAELTSYKTVIKTLKIVGGVIVLIVTLKFGDIPSLFKGGS